MRCGDKVAGVENRAAPVFEEHDLVPGTVSAGGQRAHARGHVHDALNRPPQAGRGHRLDGLRYVAAALAPRRVHGAGEFARLHDVLGVGERRQEPALAVRADDPPVMVEVEVRQRYPAHVLRRHARVGHAVEKRRAREQVQAHALFRRQHVADAGLDQQPIPAAFEQHAVRCETNAVQGVRLHVARPHNARYHAEHGAAVNAEFAIRNDRHVALLACPPGGIHARGGSPGLRSGPGRKSGTGRHWLPCSADSAAMIAGAADSAALYTSMAGSTSSRTLWAKVAKG